MKNRDILTCTIAATFAGAITMLARMAFWFGGSRDNNRGGAGGIVMFIVAPIAAFLIQMAVSRSREYAADNGSAELTGQPQALISALETLNCKREKKARGRGNPACDRAHVHSESFQRGFFGVAFFNASDVQTAKGKSGAVSRKVKM